MNGKAAWEQLERLFLDKGDQVTLNKLVELLIDLPADEVIEKTVLPMDPTPEALEAFILAIRWRKYNLNNPEEIDRLRAYNAGFDCGFNGSNERNCHFTYFSDPSKTKEWERGKADAERQREQLKNFQSREGVSETFASPKPGVKRPPTPTKPW